MFLPGRSRRLRGAAGLSIVATSSVLLAGCVQITSQEAAQLDGVGDVAVTLDLCQESTFSPFSPGSADDEGCFLTDPAPAGKQVQLFVTYAIPAAVPAPAELTVPGGAEGEKLTPDNASTATLLEEASPPAGHKWVTYRSTPTKALASTDTAGRSGVVKAAFDVSGLTGDFSYAALVSWRFASTDPANVDFAPDRAVTCGPTGDEADATLRAPLSVEPLPGTSCDTARVPEDFYASKRSGRSGRVSSTPFPGPFITGTPLPTPFITGTPIPSPEPTPEPTAEAEPTLAPTPEPAPTIVIDDEFTLFTVPVNRLALADAPEQTVTAGDAASLSFGATSKLAGKPLSVPLSGSTTAPGATVETDGSLVIGGPTDVKALVKVPATTPAGDYTVTLTAGAKSGLRTAKGILHVKAAPAPAATATPVAAPSATPVAKPQDVLEDTSETLAKIIQRGKKTKQLRRGAATVPVAVTGPGTVRVTIHGRKKDGKKFPIYAVGETYAKKAGTVDVTIKRTDLGRELLKSGEPLKATLVVRFKGPSGKFVAPGLFITLD